MEGGGERVKPSRRSLLKSIPFTLGMALPTQKTYAQGPDNPFGRLAAVEEAIGAKTLIRFDYWGWYVLWTGYKCTWDNNSLRGQWCAWRGENSYYWETSGVGGPCKKGELFELGPNKLSYDNTLEEMVEACLAARDSLLMSLPK